MAKRLKCTFKRVNGDLTGVFTRLAAGNYKTTAGILYMKNCPDGLTFYCDAEDAGNNPSIGAYRLMDPATYKLPSSGGYSASTPLYVHLKSYYVSWEEEEYSTTPVEETPAVVEEPDPDAEIEDIKRVSPSKATLSYDNVTFASDSVWSTSVGESTFTDLRRTGIFSPSYTNVTNSYSTTSSYNADYPGAAPLIEADNVNDTTSGRRYCNDWDNDVDLAYNLNILRDHLNIVVSSSGLSSLKSDYIKKFNHFKINFPDLNLSKSFTHVFFTRPDLNFFPTSSDEKAEMEALVKAKKAPPDQNVIPKVYRDNTFFYFYKNYPDLLKSLTKDFTSEHDFNPFLYNMAQSFDFSDEYIKTAEHGETYTGYKTKYGKTKIESITANSFSITYVDDDELRAYKLHKIWVDYISKVYRGELDPKRQYIRDKVLDYACSVYVIVCGPDGESILFWTKYVGVFPTNIPSSAFSWSKGNPMKLPEYSINYDYAWKEDFNPIALAEFNVNSNISIAASTNSTIYEKVYNTKLGSTGKTFVGAPYIDTITLSSGQYDFKLRFKKDSN